MIPANKLTSTKFMDTLLLYRNDASAGVELAGVK